MLLDIAATGRQGFRIASKYGVDFWIKDDPAILRRTHDVVKQGRDVMPFMPIVAHASDHNTAAKAEASFEESDPRD
jgi:hypothetical protein